jgi:serine/threonine protein kinase
MPRRGGTFLGEGTYGCVISPPPDCSRTSHVQGVLRTPKPKPGEKYIGKLFDTPDSLYDEWDQALIISKIDPKSKYFIYAEKKCEAKRSDVLKVPGATTCGIIGNTSRKLFPMLTMPFAGKTIEDHLLNAQPRIGAQELMRIIAPVFAGLIKLFRVGGIHHDIKFDNILYNPELRECRIIDLGLMVKSKHLYNESYNDFIYSDYWLHPPESRIAAELLRNNPLVPENIVNLNQNIWEGTTLDLSAEKVYLSDRIYDGFGSKTAFQQAEAAFVRAVAAHKKPIEFLAKVATAKLDVWCLGLTLAHLSQWVAKRKTGYKEMQDLIAKTLHPDPRKRISINMAQRLAKQIEGL